MSQTPRSTTSTRSSTGNNPAQGHFENPRRRKVSGDFALQREAAGEKKEEKKPDEALTLIYQNLEDRMKSVMGTKVSIHNKDKNKGRIEIEYYSEAELERIVEMIESIG